MFRPRRILFPVDFSDRSADMAAMVGSLARNFRANLTLLHVVPSHTPEEQRRAAEEGLNACGWYHFSGTRITKALREGDPATEILHFAREHRIDLILMATRGYNSAPSPAGAASEVGSVAKRVLREAVCPVWTDVHGEAPLPESLLRVQTAIHAMDTAAESEPALR